MTKGGWHCASCGVFVAEEYNELPMTCPECGWDHYRNHE